ncbi:ABC transporter ATP-binding protein [Pseudorhodoplanes sp.]|uniref:ABC transporter ATP-binding protein n=1 Tax=Pseudorhodoplanes sp. TaxID=1934341 RepID=UPI003D0E7264
MIEISDLNVHYGRVRALTSVSLSVDEGKIFAVLGANGAGKTTLLRSILGLTSAKGAIRFEGSDITSRPVAERVRRGIALVPEGRKLFPDFTVAENLRIGAFNRKDPDGVRRDIDEVCEAFPVLKERYQQEARTLSGGEGQMLAIGRALLSRPKLLLLDEPSVGLMPIFVSEIFKMIASVARNKGITVLLVEQNTKKALAVADRAAVLELGRIAFEGGASSIAADPRVKEAYLGG